MRLRTSTDVGAVIRDRRRALGLDQRALAEKVGVSRKWIIEVEKGKPRASLRLVLRTLEALGAVLRVEEPALTAPGGRSKGPLRGPLPGDPMDLDRVIQAHRRSPRAKR